MRNRRLGLFETGKGYHVGMPFGESALWIGRCASPRKDGPSRATSRRDDRCAGERRVALDSHELDRIFFVRKCGKARPSTDDVAGKSAVAPATASGRDRW